MLKITIKIEKKSDVPYIEVYFMAINNNKCYIYATTSSQILVLSYCLKIYI